jgi:hypothetical protein
LFGSGPLTKSKTMPVPPNLSVVEWVYQCSIFFVINN